MTILLFAIILLLGLAVLCLIHQLDRIAQTDEHIRFWYKVPYRQSYCKSFYLWVRTTIYCHVWLRLVSPFRRLPKIGAAMLLISLFVTFLAIGCAKDVQHITYDTTDAVGNAVDKAMQSMAAFEIAKAQQALGVTATPDQLQAWVKADPTWQRAAASHARYILAYNSWCAANAAGTAASGTNALSTTSFQAEAIAAATELTTLIASFIPSTTIVR